MDRSTPLHLLRTAAREGVHLGGVVIGGATRVARGGLDRGQAALTAAAARRRQPPRAPAATSPEKPSPAPSAEPRAEQAAPAAAEPAPATTEPPAAPATRGAPSPSDVAKRAHPRPAATRPPARKKSGKPAAGPGAKLPPRRREADDD